MPRGRPLHSPIRQNIVEVLGALGSGYGYQIFLVYRKVFPRASIRSIYHHLNKGVDTGEFLILKVETEKGDYSWGKVAEKTYYKLGPKAQPRGDERVKSVVEKINLEPSKSNSQ